MSKYIINSDLSEKQLESDVSGFFGWMSKGTPFRLLDINEQLTGADKKFYDSGYAFFMQFKVSKGLEPISKIPASARRNRSPLEDVREFRKKHHLQDDPSMFFELRRKAERANDLQHNILIELANKPFSQAFYVAPLHLNKSNYYSCLFDSVSRFRPHPFDYKNYKIYRDSWVSYVGHVPFLKEHVSIIPHERVATHQHYYSYSPTGCEIGWHSPELYSDGPSRLSDLLDKELSDCIGENRFHDLYQIEEMLDIRSTDALGEHQSPLDRLQHWGKDLYLNNRIRMFIFLGNSDHIESYRERNI